MRRPLLTPLVVAALLAAPARAQEPSPPPGPPPVIAAGVTVAGVAVGGLTEEEAKAAVQVAFDRKLPFVFRTHRWSVSPYTLGSYAYVSPAVSRALAAEAGERIPLPVRVHDGRIRRYVGYLDRVFSRAPRNSLVSLRRLRPYLTKARPGWEVRRLAMERAIKRALARTERAPIQLRTVVRRPSVTRTNYGPIIVIRRGSRRLYLYRGMRFVRLFRIAVGMRAYPTPLGRFHIVVMERNPTWNPPASDWAAGLGPVPPGPGNPLGTRWMGLSAPGIGIHGTPHSWTVGTAASHGCIRMYIRESEWLFARVRIGTPVFIVSG